MKIKLISIFILITSSLLASEVIWSNKQIKLNDKEYKKIINDYVNKTYPNEVKKWNKNSSYKRKKTSNFINKNIIYEDLINKDVKNWSEANKYCKNLDLYSKNNWRLPSVKELKYIYSIKEDFNIKNNGWFWSNRQLSTHDNKIYAYALNFSSGYDVGKDISKQYYVNCVHNN